MNEQQIKSKLLEELNLVGLTQEKQDELIVKVTEVVLKRVFLETMERLEGKGQAEYAMLMENDPSPEDVDEFLNEKISGYEEMVHGIIQKLIEEMKNAK
jgi:hypothetical protein